MFSNPCPKPTSWSCKAGGSGKTGKTKRIARSTYLLKNVASMKAERVVKSCLGHFQPLSSSYVLVPTLFAFLSTQHAILSFLIASPRVELTA